MNSDISHPEVGADNSFSFETEKSEQFLVRNLVRSGMTVFDVGANIGDYSILFSNLVGDSGKVYVFEPASSTFSKLQQRLEEHNCHNVVALQKAVFSHNETVTLNEFPDDYSAWNSLGMPTMQDPSDPSKLIPIVASETIDAVTLDRFCSENNIEKIDYLKIDVEGAERDVLHGTTHLLEKQAIDFIQFEISKNMLDGLSRNAKDVFALLIQFGYQCHRIQYDGEVGESAVDSNAFYENYIAFPHLSPRLQSLFGRLPDKLQQTRVKLQQVETELTDTGSKLQHTQTELVQSKTKFDETQNQLYATQIQLAETQAQLVESRTKELETQSQLNQIKTELEGCEAKLHQTEATLQQSENQVQHLRERLEHVRTRLKNAREEIKGSLEKISAMESSKFWKLRKGWLKVKRTLRLRMDD